MNILFCSAGRRCKLIENFRSSMGADGKIVAADVSCFAPALQFADRKYLVPRIDDAAYIPTLVKICQQEKIDVIFPLIDPEIEVLSRNRNIFEQMGMIVAVPFLETARLCFDKYEMFLYLKKVGIDTIQTYKTFDAFMKDYQAERISFPVFVKPRTGSGSIGAQKVDTLEKLKNLTDENPSLIIQEYMDGIDLDADVYVDMVSREVVSAFSKKKISVTLGGANKTVSFKDENLFAFIRKISSVLELFGPNDMDFFYKDGRYYLSEINPRFGGAYLHAYGAGVDFIKLIDNNVHGVANTLSFGDYEEDIVMMMYDNVVVKPLGELENE